MHTRKNIYNLGNNNYEFMNYAMNVGFTGSRTGMKPEQLTAVTRLLEDLRETAQIYQNKLIILHHGDCIGSDVEVHNIARRLGYHIAIHPPTRTDRQANCTSPDISFSRQPYLTRNRNIVDMTEMLIATPDGLERERSGTWHTVRYARRLGRPVHIILPNAVQNPEKRMA